MEKGAKPRIPVAVHVASLREPDTHPFAQPRTLPSGDTATVSIHPGLLDPRIIPLMERLHPEHGPALLSALCARATHSVPAPLLGQEVAVITCHGIPDLLHTPGWQWGRETTLKWLQLLEALSIVIRFRRGNQTEIHLPLGPRQLNKTTMMHHIEQCSYRNPKTRQLFRRALDAMNVLSLPTHHGLDTSHALPERPDVHRVVHQLLTMLQQERISQARRKRIALWLSEDLMQSGRPSPTIPAPESPSCTFCPHPGRSPSTKSPTSTMSHPFSANQWGRRGTPESPDDPPEWLYCVPEGDAQQQPHQTAPTSTLITDSSSMDTSPESPWGDHGANGLIPESPIGPVSALEGDSPMPNTRASNSSIEERVFQIGKEKELEFETRATHETAGNSAADHPTWPSLSEQEQETETHTLWLLLYTPDQRTGPDGQHLRATLRRRVKQRPDLVRAAMVNVLMQNVFPDRHGVPLERARWFYRSYRLYLSEQLSISPQIASWVASAATYQQIEEALHTEQRRQQCAWLPAERPFASCMRAPSQDEPSLITAAECDEQRERPAMETTNLSATDDETPFGQHQQSSGQQPAPAPTDGSQESPQVQDTTATNPAVETYEIIHVETPEVGWNDLVGVQWWEEKVRASPLAQECLIEILPTQHGRFVLILTPYQDASAAWMWSNGRQVRTYLENVRAVQKAGKTTRSP